MPAAAEAPPMRPRGILSLLDASVGLYRRHFFLFVAISALPTVPLYLAQIALAAIQTDVLGGPFDFENATREPTPDEMASILIFNAAAFAIWVVRYGLAVPLATGALTAAVATIYVGGRATVGGAFGPVLRIVWMYLLTSALVGLVIGGAWLMVACFCLGLPLFFVFWAWFAMTPAVMIVEGHTGIAAMNRSRRLCDGHTLRLVGAGIVIHVFYFLLLTVFAGAVFGAAFAWVESPTLQMVLIQAAVVIVETITMPFMSLVPILLYYDLRIRKEGFDLALAAHRLADRPVLA
jgi:hypothetical protein